MEGDVAPRSMVPSTISMLGSFSGLRRFFLPFTVHTHGLRRLLRRAKYISAPCGWEQGAKWAVLGTGTVFRFFNRFLGAVFETDNRPFPHRFLGYFKITGRA